MPRAKSGFKTRRQHKKILKLAKGYRGARSKLFKKANEAVLRAGEHAFRGRKVRKRDMRKLWIRRINAALTPFELRYSLFVHGLKKAEINLNRKMLSEIALNDPKAFSEIVEKVKKSL